MQVLNVPTTNISALKKSPKKVIEIAKSTKNGVYIFNRNEPEAVVLDVKDYETLVNKINVLEDKLLDAQVEAISLDRINRRKEEKNPKSYSFEDIFGEKLSDAKVDENDGWE